MVATLDNGQTSAVQLDSSRHIEVAIHGPVDAFGRVQVASPTPRVQIDATYGILTTDHETLTDGVSGGAVVTGGLFTCTTGASVGGYGVVRSKRLVRYRPGQGVEAEFTTLCPVAGVANSLLVAGMFNAEDALFVGYSGTAFGFMRRIAGAAAIHRLTITVGAGGAENMTVTLNGVAFVVASGGILSTTATAERITEVGTFTGWSSVVSPTSNGATVTFIQGTPAATAGAFTFASTGTAAGTFATIQAGAANDSTTGFIAQTAWNVDRLDGTNGTYNPTGMLLNPAKLNVWRIKQAHLGGGQIELQVQTPANNFQTVHIIEYPNSATIPNQRNPTYRIGWVAASLGSTTALTMQGASGAGFVSGELVSARDPVSLPTLITFSAGTTEYVAVAIRVRGEFATFLNQRECFPADAIIGVETSNRIATARCVVNPTMTGTVNWQYVDQATSAVEYATPTTIVASSGRTVATTVTSASGVISLRDLDLRLEPGDVLALCVATVSSSSAVAIALNWQER